MPQIALSLNDREDVFGNDAADHEDPEVLVGYFYRQDDFDDFHSAKRDFLFVVGRKGVGKSALLRYSEQLRRQPSSVSQGEANAAPFVLSLNASDIALDLKPGATAAERIAEWQRRICARLCAGIGESIDVALTDSAISIVEHSELTGFRGRNLFASLSDRLAIGVLPLTRQRPELASAVEALKRYSIEHSARAIWLYIDNMDATFTRTTEECLRLSSFLVACKDLTLSVSDLFIRTSLRSDVWAAVRLADEALDKYEQYEHTISWSRNGTRAILARRIRAAWYRKWQLANALSGAERADKLRFPAAGPSGIPEIRSHSDEDAMVAKLFADDFTPPVGKRDRSAYADVSAAHHHIHVHSQGRPRWAMQLCKAAAKEAQKVRAPRIAAGHFEQVLHAFGARAIKELHTEFQHACPRLQEILYVFSRARIRWTTSDLLRFLQERVIDQLGHVHIDAKDVKDPLPIAQFLFRIGFLSAVDKPPKGKSEYYRFEERAHLLQSSISPDDGMLWDIHPTFRGVLFSA